MKKFINSIIYAFEKNPARLSGYVSSIALYLNKEADWFPAALLIPSIMFVIFVAEAAQRYEDKKTIKALKYIPDPDVPDEEELRIVISHYK